MMKHGQSVPFLSIVFTPSRMRLVLIGQTSQRKIDGAAVNNRVFKVLR